MSEPRRWTVKACSKCGTLETEDCRCPFEDEGYDEPVEVMPVSEHEELLRGPVHGLIQTIRGMCSDERPWTEIDAKLAELDDLICGQDQRANSIPIPARPYPKWVRDALDSAGDRGQQQG